MPLRPFALRLVLAAWIAVILGTGAQATLTFRGAPSAAEAAAGGPAERAGRAAAARSNVRLFSASAVVQLALAGLAVALACWPPPAPRAATALVVVAALGALLIAVAITPPSTRTGLKVAANVERTGSSGLEPEELRRFGRLHAGYAALALGDVALLAAALLLGRRWRSAEAQPSPRA